MVLPKTMAGLARHIERHVAKGVNPPPGSRSSSLMKNLSEAAIHMAGIRAKPGSPDFSLKAKTLYLLSETLPPIFQWLIRIDIKVLFISLISDMLTVMTEDEVFEVLSRSWREDWQALRRSAHVPVDALD